MWNIYLVDDDPFLLRALTRAIQSAGYEVVSCRSADEFLANYRPDQAGCVVLDVAMPNMSGEELHLVLMRRGGCPPVIFMTGGDEISIAVRAMKDGAVDFLTKPFETQTLIEAISSAVGSRDGFARGPKAAANARLWALSPRELEIFAHVVRGKLSRNIARELAISVKTVKAHRAMVRRKLGTRSVAGWIRVARDADFSIMPVIPTSLCGRGGARYRKRV